MRRSIAVLIILLASLFTLHGIYAQEVMKPEVSTNVWFFKSKAVREMRIVLPGNQEKEQVNAPNRFAISPYDRKDDSIPADKLKIQKEYGSVHVRGPLLNIEGIGNVNGVIPADPNGDAGTNHYIQTVNNSFALWDKNGNLLNGPVANQTIWSSFPGPWSTYNWTDPVFKYDHLADRWIIISWAYNNTDNYTMIAVSNTSDPLGSYYCYAYLHQGVINDYPKVSIWPDGYYLTYSFWESDTYLYPAVAVVDRDEMLGGGTEAEMIIFPIITPVEGFYFPLSADIRGSLAPVDEPCWVVSLGRQDTINQLMVSLDIYAFEINWNDPLNSSFNLVSSFEIGEFPPIFDFGPGAPQKGSSTNVMTIPWFMMYPLTYRMFPDHEKMVCCHTVWDGMVHYIKWYELRKETSEWNMYQSGNYAPNDAHYFFPSLSVNGNGDIAMGYSVSSDSLYPSIYFTGRRAEDSLGMMTFQELHLYHGLSYTNSYNPLFDQNRWGDYTSMMVDPSDDTTFWYTNMYTNSSNFPGNWSTRIFKLDLSPDTIWPYAFAGNDTAILKTQTFFETQGQGENYSFIIWTTSGDGIFNTNYAEHVSYQRGPEDLANGEVTLTMSLKGYYSGVTATDSMILSFMQVGLAEPPESIVELNVFPNPTSDNITIQAKVTDNEPLIVEVLELGGKKIYTGRYIPACSHLELEFDLSYLIPGIYFIQVLTKNGVAMKKVMVH